MKNPIAFAAGFVLALIVVLTVGAVVSQSNGIFFLNGNGTDPKILGLQVGQSVPWIEFNSKTNMYFQVASNGMVTGQSYVIAGTTNQLVFGATNTEPANATNFLWVSVQVAGDATSYRISLYK